MKIVKVKKNNNILNLQKDRLRVTAKNDNKTTLKTKNKHSICRKSKNYTGTTKKIIVNQYIKITKYKQNKIY